MPDAVREARDSLAGALCEARYLAFPGGSHHDVQTCETCRRRVDEALAAVRAATIAACVEAVEALDTAPAPSRYGDGLADALAAIRAVGEER